MLSVEIVDLSAYDHDHSLEIVKKRMEMRIPIVFRGLDIGMCLTKWKIDENLYRHNPNKVVSVHMAKKKELDFKNKNFVYRNMPLKEFIEAAVADSEDQWFYLRTLGEDVRKDRTHFQQQFPELSSDLLIPDVFPKESYFSSVFRVSSKDCRLWTHYDTMDNILIQIRGEKTIIFYSPFDVEYLYIEDGKSPILCPENKEFDKYPLLAKATPFVANMVPGDFVYIPALWFHNVTAHDFSVAVNVFWYHLKEDQYDRRDVYGNKDPLPVVRATQSIDNAIKALSTLPPEYQHLYGLSLIDRLSNKLLKQNTN